MVSIRSRSVLAAESTDPSCRFGPWARAQRLSSRRDVVPSAGNQAAESSRSVANLVAAFTVVADRCRDIADVQRLRPVCVAVDELG